MRDGVEQTWPDGNIEPKSARGTPRTTLLVSGKSIPALYATTGNCLLSHSAWRFHQFGSVATRSDVTGGFAAISYRAPRSCWPYRT
jgi:hypothetical protein